MSSVIRRPTPPGTTFAYVEIGGALPSFLVSPLIVLLHALNVISGMLSDILLIRSITGDLSVLNKLIPALNATISI
ncbi:MAG: hypothetical protein QNK69_02240 [Amylibacter sp.]